MWKACILYHSKYRQSQQAKTIEYKTSVVAKGWEEEDDEEAVCEGLPGQWHYCVRCKDVMIHPPQHSEGRDTMSKPEYEP